MGLSFPETTGITSLPLFFGGEVQVRIWVAKAKSLCIYYGTENEEQGRPQTVPKSSYCVSMALGQGGWESCQTAPFPQDKSLNADRMPYKES